MSHAVSEDLARRVGQYPACARREGIIRAWNDYVTACFLSGGPISDRAAHWAEKAMTMELAITGELDSCKR